MSNKLIDIVNVSKSYGENLVLNNLNLYIRENEFLTLLGPSGCGKTSICNDFVVMKNQRPGRITVLLVAEDLGY